MRLLSYLVFIFVCLPDRQLAFACNNLSDDGSCFDAVPYEPPAMPSTRYVEGRINPAPAPVTQPTYYGNEGSRPTYQQMQNPARSVPVKRSNAGRPPAVKPPDDTSEPCEKGTIYPSGHRCNNVGISEPKGSQTNSNTECRDFETVSGLCPDSNKSNDTSSPEQECRDANNALISNGSSGRYDYRNGQCLYYNLECEQKSQEAMNTCDMDKNSETKAFTDNADKAAKAYATAQQGGAISSCNEMRQVAAAANTALATLKAQCSVVVSECNRVCNGDQITGTKLCSQASARVKDADMNTTQAVIGFQDQQCDTLQKALSGLAGGSGGGDGISGKMYVPSSNLSNALPGMKSPSGASSYASTGNTVGGSTGGPSQKGLGATDLGSLMNTDEDAIYGDSQTAAGKAGGSGGGSGLGGNSGGGGGGPGKQQKGVASRPGLNTNINRGFVGSSAMPGFGGPGGVGAAGGGVGGPNGRPGIGPNGQQPDWRKFLPGGQYDPRRGIAGVTGPDGITGPATNLFDKVHNRYGAVGHSLKP